MLRTAVVAVMFAITGTTAALLSARDCSVILGASPLAWGFTVWWLVDTVAKATLWPWRNGRKLRKTALAWKNVSAVVLLAGASSRRRCTASSPFVYTSYICNAAIMCRRRKPDTSRAVQRRS
jgi:hypothetical protein